MCRVAGLTVCTALVFGLGVSAAVATPPKEASRTDIARAVMTGGGLVDIEPGKETTVHRATIAPGGSTGWHTHHDGGVFMVVSGTMTTYGLDGPACEAITVPAGQAYFVPPNAHHPHLVLNKGAEPLKLVSLYFNVPKGASSRIDAEAPAECPAELR